MLSMGNISKFILLSLIFSLLTTFQNCNRVQFSAMNEDLSSLDWCDANPNASECINPLAVQCRFNGVTYSDGQTVTAYLSSSVGFGETCVSETRTCSDGVFTGSYAYPSCSAGIPMSCLFNGETVAHNATVLAYQNSTVSFGGQCVSENRTCSDGVLSGSYSFASCTPGAPASCLFNGNTIPHGQSVQAYARSSVAYGESCLAMTRTCYNGLLSNSGDFASCSVDAPATCLFNGQTLAHGAGLIAYLNANVSFGNTCTSQRRICNNGVLSGSYNFANCQVNAALSCQFNGQTVSHGQVVRAYQNTSVPFGSLCNNEDRTCINGQLSGSYNFATCSVTAASACTFNGQTVAHGASVTAYQSSSVPATQSCVKQTRTCNNGSLNGTYNFASCVVNAPRSCLFNGQTISSGQSVVAYQSSSVGFGQSCVSQNRTCNDGVLSGNYAYGSCTVASPKSCLFNGKTIAHGQNVTAYAVSTVPFGQTCPTQIRSCNNGTLSGTYAFANCSPEAPVSCLLDGQTIAHNQDVVAYTTRSVPFGQRCSGIRRLCTNGDLSQSDSYKYLSCAVKAPNNCTFNGQSIPHGSSVIAYAQSQVSYGQSCTPQAQTRTCNNGTLSGTYTHQTCTVAAPKVAMSTGQHCDIGGKWGWRSYETQCPSGMGRVSPAAAGGCPAGFSQYGTTGCYISNRDSRRPSNNCGSADPNDECCVTMCSQAYTPPTWTCRRDSYMSGSGENMEAIQANTCTCINNFGDRKTTSWIVTQQEVKRCYDYSDSGTTCTVVQPEIAACEIPSN